LAELLQYIAQKQVVSHGVVYEVRFPTYGDLGAEDELEFDAWPADALLGDNPASAIAAVVATGVAQSGSPYGGAINDCCVKAVVSRTAHCWSFLFDRSRHVFSLDRVTHSVPVLAFVSQNADWIPILFLNSSYCSHNLHPQTTVSAMKFLTLRILSLAASASAFSTNKQMKPSFSLHMAEEGEVPVNPVVGTVNNTPMVNLQPKMSQSLPFLQRPTALDGSLVGDVGFDPLGFAKTKADLVNYREAEIKHGRLAMLVCCHVTGDALF
jgi:Chlorophyll A-B binding protein